MRKMIFIAFASFGMLYSCSDNDSDNTLLEGTWNLTSITGGFAGVDCSYDDGDLVWIFDDINLEIINKLTMDTLCHSITRPSETLPYSILDTNNMQFLILNESDWGPLINLGDDSFTLDENIGPGGQGADGFFMSFERE